MFFFLFKDTATTESYTDVHTRSRHDALPICSGHGSRTEGQTGGGTRRVARHRLRDRRGLRRGGRGGVDLRTWRRGDRGGGRGAEGTWRPGSRRRLQIGRAHV